MTAVTSFFWPRKGDWKASERALFPTLMSLTTKGKSIWSFFMIMPIQLWERIVLPSAGAASPQVLHVIWGTTVKDI